MTDNDSIKLESTPKKFREDVSDHELIKCASPDIVVEAGSPNKVAAGSSENVDENGLENHEQSPKLQSLDALLGQVSSSETPASVIAEPAEESEESETRTCETASDSLPKLEDPDGHNHSGVSTGSLSTKSVVSPSEMIHQVKWINWASASDKNTLTAIVTQNENGPCPLLALINVLLLRGQARLQDGTQIVTSQELLDLLTNCIVRMVPEKLDAHEADYQRNFNDALSMLPKLLTGIDVNVKFTRIDDFEYTDECLVFDLLNIPLYHGWLVEPENKIVAEAVGHSSYNQLAEMIVNAKHDETDKGKLDQAFLVEQFLQSTASQLTYHGLCELTSSLKDGTLCVFFRNNHFSTLRKHNDNLYLLVTDQGFLNESKVVWETLNNVEGDSCFVDAEFHPMPAKSVDVPLAPVDSVAMPPNASPQEQIDHDLMVAMSLEEQERAASAFVALEQADAGITAEERDRRLALQLQEEERIAAEGELRQQRMSPGAAGHQQVLDSPNARRRAQSSDHKSSRCTIV